MNKNFCDWQPIETAPKDGSRIVLFEPERRNKITTGKWEACFVYKYNEAGEAIPHGEWSNCDNVLHPTHWCIIAEPATK